MNLEELNSKLSNIYDGIIQEYSDKQLFYCRIY